MEGASSALYPQKPSSHTFFIYKLRYIENLGSLIGQQGVEKNLYGVLFSQCALDWEGCTIGNHPTTVPYHQYKDCIIFFMSIVSYIDLVKACIVWEYYWQNNCGLFCTKSLVK